MATARKINARGAMNVGIIIIVFFGFVHLSFGQGLTTEQRVVAQTILGEARGEGEAGMYAVACVIAQRSINRNKTPKQICLQRGKKVWQFSCWNPSDPNRKKLPELLKTHQHAAYAKALAINLTRLQRGYVKNADHYCNININNYWTRNSKPVAIIGKHKFFKLR